MTESGMTGPRSPSSPWVQNPHRDGAQSFLTISPSGASNLDRSSPNYFGMSTHNSNQSANMGPVQKNWGHSPQSAHSPKIHVHPQELVSAGLVSMLKTEPETNRLRRESTFSDSFNGKQVSPGPKTSPSFPLGGFSLVQPSAPRGGTGRNSVSTGISDLPSPCH